MQLSKRHEFDMLGYDPEKGECTKEARKVEIFAEDERMIVVLGCPGVEDHERPDLCIEWQPNKGWCVYVHGHGSDEVQMKLVLNPDSVVSEEL